jgi:GNAT superfamily N-acetyltransferase
VHRTAPFTDTEQARGSAMAGLVNDVLGRIREGTTVATASPRRLGTVATPEYVVGDDSVAAYVDGVLVGTATLGEARLVDGVTLRPVDLGVDPGWQRRGIGTRLLLDAARAAGASGADELLLTTAADNPAVLPMVLGAGLRGRIRMAADQLTVRVPVGGLKPLTR